MFSIGPYRLALFSALIFPAIKWRLEHPKGCAGFDDRLTQLPVGFHLPAEILVECLLSSALQNVFFFFLIPELSDPLCHLLLKIKTPVCKDLSHSIFQYLAVCIHVLL